MNELTLANRAADWHRLKALVLDSVSSPITKRVYNLGLDEFIAWYSQEPRPGFTKATVAAWRVALEARGPWLRVDQRADYGGAEAATRLASTCHSAGPDTFVRAVSSHHARQAWPQRFAPAPRRQRTPGLAAQAEHRNRESWADMGACTKVADFTEVVFNQ
jgi:hypothetical protein